MIKLDLEYINSHVTKIANAMLMDVTAKEKVRDELIALVALACETVTHDEEFKKEMEACLVYFRSK